jgi:hypothetical protein
MKKNAHPFIVFTFLVLLVAMFAVQPLSTAARDASNDPPGGMPAVAPAASTEPADPVLSNPRFYVVPAIADNQISIPSSGGVNYVSSELNLNGSPGEYRPATFIIAADKDFATVETTASDLSGQSGRIDQSSVDLSIVKSWYQAGVGVFDVSHKRLTPELLVKDDSLIEVRNGENYLKLADGSYIWISSPQPSPSANVRTPVEKMPVSDASTLQPFDLQAGVAKQIWITLHIPESAAPGAYRGSIVLSVGGKELAELSLNLRVWPIHLEQSYLTYSAYYAGELVPEYPQGTISDRYKSPAQMSAELVDMLAYGVTDPTFGQRSDGTTTWLTKNLEIRKSQGLGDQPLFCLDASISRNLNEVKNMLSLAHDFGISDVYFYGIDEAKGDELLSQRPFWEQIRAAGGKIFASGYAASRWPPGNYAAVGDLQDLFVAYGSPNSTEAAKWHSIGHQIFDYSNPQFGQETPETYRRNYGLLLWQQDYDGEMDFAYQWGAGDIWNDFDDPKYRDHVMAYPTVNGVIDTIQWEGFREGVNDTRYLTTLLDLIAQAKTLGLDTAAYDSWLSELKAANLAKLDLDSTRSSMIKFILELQDEMKSAK